MSLKLQTTSAPSHERVAAVLMALFSLRGARDWGVGEIPDLVPFARWARACGLRAIQLLPVHEVSRGETSPYSAVSALALDPVYVGLADCEDFLAAGGESALPPEARGRLAEVRHAAAVQWETVRALKREALELGFRHFLRHEWQTGSDRARALERFRASEPWVDDYALYYALADRYGQSFRTWPEGLRDRHPEALAAARTDFEIPVLYRVWVEWVLHNQWQAARRAAEELGVELWGDLPFVVSGDAADVWLRRSEFRAGVRLGVPPDAFSAEGQDWGLPVFDWDAMAANGFGWMRERAAREAELYARYRVDHVVGLYRTYYRRNDGGPPGFSPPDEPAQLRQGETALGILGAAGRVIAEDLGVVPDFVRESLARMDIPGFRVLRWEKRHDGSFRDPQREWPTRSVATNGTHDTEPSAAWWTELPRPERRALLTLPGLEGLREDQAWDETVRDALLRLLYQAPSELLIVPFQDLFGGDERINVPGTVGPHNWTYRTRASLADLEADRATTSRLAALARESGRDR